MNGAAFELPEDKNIASSKSGFFQKKYKIYLYFKTWLY